MAQAFSLSAPQDVINEIVSYIHTDAAALKVCSLTSSAFYEPTRKYLFATTTLDQPDVVVSLNRAFERNTGLSGFIRSLEIPSLDEDTLREVVSILPALSQTHRLVLGMDACIHSVHIPSPGVLILLSSVLQLPLLDTLEILSIRGFPASHLHIAQGLKSLTAKNTPIAISEDTEATLCPLPQLLSIYLHRVWSWNLALNAPLILDAPNLLQVVISAPESAIQPIFQAGADSIKTIVWVNYVHGRSYLGVDLGVLRNLRRLCFVLSSGDEEDSCSCSTWDSISKILCGTIAQSLEELSLAIKQGRDDLVVINKPTVVHTLGFVGLGNIWTDLADKRQFPRLVKIAIHLVNERCDSPVQKTDEFHSIISQKVPLLAETGLLHTTVCEQFEWRDFL